MVEVKTEKKGNKVIIEIKGDIRSFKKLGDQEFNEDDKLIMTIGPSAFDPEKRFVVEVTLGNGKMGRYYLIKKDNGQTSLEH